MCILLNFTENYCLFFTLLPYYVPVQIHMEGYDVKTVNHHFRYLINQ